MGHNKFDKKILKLIIILKQLGIIRSYRDFCEPAGILEQNLYHVRKGRIHFTIEQIDNCIKTYQVSAKWLFNQQKDVFLNDQLNDKINLCAIDAEYEIKYNQKTDNLNGKQ